MTAGPFFAIDNQGFFILAPGNIITGERIDEIYNYLHTVGYYALRKFYMGGGIEGELKVNRLEMLPIPYNIKMINKEIIYKELQLTSSEIEKTESYIREF